MYPVLFNGEAVRAVLKEQKTQTRRPVKPQPVPSSMGDGLWVVKTDGKLSGMACINATDWDVHYWCERWRPYEPGDHLWIREAFILEETDELPIDGWPYREMEEPGEFGKYLVPHYRATEPEPHIVPLDLSDDYDDRTRWCASIHMPRWASRITLEVTDVRVQRVQDISEAEARAEGVEPVGLECGDWIPVSGSCYVIPFKRLWDSIYAMPKPVYRNKKIAHYVSYPWESGIKTWEHGGLPWYVYGNPWVFATSFKSLKG